MNAGKGVKLQPWKEMSHGTHVFEPGNAVNFKTGDWRSDVPVFVSENCKQCLLCFPVCPDSAIVLAIKVKLQVLTSIFAKVACAAWLYAISKL